MLPEIVLPAPEHHLHVGEEQLTKDLKESASTAAQGFNGELGVKHPRPLAPTAPPPPALRRASSKQSPGCGYSAAIAGYRLESEWQMRHIWHMEKLQFIDVAWYTCQLPGQNKQTSKPLECVPTSAKNCIPDLETPRHAEHPGSCDFATFLPARNVATSHQPTNQATTHHQPSRTYCTLW